MIWLAFLLGTAQAEPYRYLLVADKTYTAAEKAQLKVIERKINELSVSSCLESWIVEDKKRSKLIQANGKTRAQVFGQLGYDTALARVTMYRTDKDVIGYRNKGSNLIHTNAKYYRESPKWKGKICPRVSNMFHELSHVLGFTHDYDRTKRRPYSVPYTISAAVNECCLEDIYVKDPPT